MTQSNLTTAPGKPSVYTYTDYRTFLYDVYEFKKNKNPSFSYNVFSRLMGISKTHLRMIIERNRNLIDSKVPGVVQACQLDEQEAKFFQTLVRWNQTDDAGEKSRLMGVLQSQIPQGNVVVLHNPQKNLVRRWYVLALLEMIRSNDFQSDSEQLAARFFGQVSPQEIQAALDDLEFLGVVRRDAGRVHIVKSLYAEQVLTAQEVQLLHAQHVPLAIQALTQIPSEEREFSSDALAFSKADFEKIQEEVKKLRRMAIELSQKTLSPENVYQLNFQLYPYSATGSSIGKSSSKKNSAA